MQVLKIFILGWGVLIFAILVNVIAKSVKIATWYDFLSMIGERGLKSSFASLGIFEILFLFVIYPGILGLVAYLGWLWLFRL